MKSLSKGKCPILVIDDDEGLLLSIKAAIVSAGLPEPDLISDSRSVMDKIQKSDFHLVILDLIMPYIGGMELLKKIKEEYPSMESVVITAIDDVATAVQALKYDAYDYLVKPVTSEKLIITIKHALERYNLRNGLALYERNQRFSELKNPEAFKDMIAHDDSMAMVFHQAEIAAPTDYNIVVTGESGTGKEMLARIIHALSDRNRGPFVTINMAAFSRNLIEDDLFGHERGAYTGALSDKKGFFEAAQEGTIFLDEITELELPLQGKLLRVIQDRELYRLGSTELKNIDVRILSATNKDIKEAINKGQFREDLFYRLNMFHIHIPPLRERKKDIVPLAYNFLKIHAERNKKKIDSISTILIQEIINYPFPGNVRELENIIAHAVLFENGRELSYASAKDQLKSSGTIKKDYEILRTLEEIEIFHIHKVLSHTGHNKTKAAKILGIGLRTLQRKLKGEALKPSNTSF
ncbi:MAG: sigma-54 dependent transcriptional regulator [Syntrophales bacterium]|jgi:DNA-binding NtrC family response regulator|nr:sigma-54 dependent transcriptional regulator [Syntrophales bacterium]MDY0043640.1 sigma-54 dependent transcriptional regulator [Syntrophales bacterium]